MAEEPNEGDVEHPRGENAHVICIPRVNNKITKQYIFGIFCSLKVGFIEKVVEIPLRNEEGYKCVLVKIKWNQSDRSKYIYERFEMGKNVKIVYSDPWYWICVSNNRGKGDARPKEPPRELAVEG